MNERDSVSEGVLAAMWVACAVAFLGWCSYVGWAYVTFYDYSGAARGFLVGLGLVTAVLLGIYIAICAIATDEWQRRSS